MFKKGLGSRFVGPSNTSVCPLPASPLSIPWVLAHSSLSIGIYWRLIPSLSIGRILESFVWDFLIDRRRHSVSGSLFLTLRGSTLNEVEPARSFRVLFAARSIYASFDKISVSTKARARRSVRPSRERRCTPGPPSPPRMPA